MAITISTKAAQTVGVGLGLVGVVYAVHKFRVWRAREKLREMAQRAAAGEIPTREFLDAALASGQVQDPGTGKKITVEDAPRLRCEVVFGTFGDGRFLPGFDAAIAEMRRIGTCL